jgi:hypothetical protein
MYMIAFEALLLDAAISCASMHFSERRKDRSLFSSLLMAIEPLESHLAWNRQAKNG